MMDKAKSTAAGRNHRLIEEWTAKIDATIGSQRSSVFDLGDLLLSAKGELSKASFKKAVKASGLKSDSNANNYMRVSDSKHLRDPSIIGYLPTTVGALIDLAAWHPKELRKAADEGILTPSVKRSSLVKWRSKFHDGLLGRAQLRSAQKALNDGIVVGYVVAQQDSWRKASFETLDDFISQAHSIENVQNFYITYRQSTARSFSDLRVKAMVDSIIKRYADLGRDGYEADGMTAIFGDYPTIFSDYAPLQRPLDARYEKWLPTLLTPECAEQRAILQIDEDVVTFLVDWLERKRALTIEENKKLERRGILDYVPTT